MTRWAGGAGIAFVVLAIASAAAQGDVPSTDAANATEEFARFYGDEDNHVRAVISAVLGLVGQFFFLWFIGGLWSLLRSSAGATTTPTMVLVLGGAGSFTLGALEHVIGNMVGIVLNFSEGGYRLDPGLALILSGLAQGMFLAAMIATAAAALAAGLLARSTGVLPGWLLWVAVAMTVLALPTIPPLSFLAAVLFAFWVIVISVALIQRGHPQPLGATSPR